MSYRILTKNSVDNTNIDGARQNHFNAGMRSGVVKGALNECNVTSPASNQIVINTGELRISGHQIVITESEQMQLTTTPQTETEYSIIAEINVDNLSTPTFRMFIQPKSSGLIQDNLFTTLNGVGTYQIKLANFTQNTNGTISDVIRSAELIGENDTQILIDNINSTLENKANKDLSNVTYPKIVYNPATEEFDGLVHTGAGDRVVGSKVYSDGKTWYRKWASGWKECGGHYDGGQGSGGYGEFSITLPIAFENANYTVMCSGLQTTSLNWDYGIHVANKTKTTIQIKCRMGDSFAYHCCGY